MASRDRCLLPFNLHSCLRWPQHLPAVDHRRFNPEDPARYCPRYAICKPHRTDSQNAP